MSYLVLARKYRPRRFDDVVGQQRIAQTIKNSIEQGRVAHAYIFSGPRGVGKTSLARILAAVLNCQEAPPTEACGECDSCRGVAAGTDIDVIEIDGASNNRVDEIRDLRDNVKYTSARGGYKIYIIDEVHMLTTAAFNALLKTLEEPPGHVKFLLATTEPQKLPDTIKSRCQFFEFRRISESDITRRLGEIARLEDLEIDEDILLTIARSARGGMRDALSALDQLIAFRGADGEAPTQEEVREILGLVSRGALFDLVDRVLERDSAGAMLALDEMLGTGRQTADLVDVLLQALRDLMILASCGERGEKLIEETAEGLARLRELAGRFSVETLLYWIRTLSDVRERATRFGQGRLFLETALVKLATQPEVVPLDQLLAAVDRLERSGGAPPAPRPQPGGGGTARPAPPSAAPRSRPTGPRQERATPPGHSTRPATDPESAASGEPWDQLLALVGRKNMPLNVALKTVQFHGVEGDRMRLALPGESRFQRSALEEHGSVLEECVQAVFGRKLTIQLEGPEADRAEPRAAEAAADGSSAPPRPSAPNRPRPSSEPPARSASLPTEVPAPPPSTRSERPEASATAPASSSGSDCAASSTSITVSEEPPAAETSPSNEALSPADGDSSPRPSTPNRPPRTSGSRAPVGPKRAGPKKRASEGLQAKDPFVRRVIETLDGELMDGA